MFSFKGRTKKHVLIAASIIFVFIVVFAITGSDFILNFYSLTEMETPDLELSGSRLMVIAPHNDDEALSAAVLISHVKKAGGQVKVVILTNGDGHTLGAALKYFKLRPGPGDYIRLAYFRQNESIAAMKLAGITEEDIIFLGYPDGGLYSMWIGNWESGNPYTSKYTGLNSSPYYNSFRPNAQFCGENLASDLENIILDFSPTILIYPHPNDKHPDHVAAHYFVNYVTQKNDLSCLKYLYLVHRGEWPSPFGHFPKLYLVPPFELLNTGTTWYRYELDECDVKLKASIIRRYRSQTNITGPFLRAFIRKNELLGEYPEISLDADPVLIIEDPVHRGIKTGDIKNIHIHVTERIFKAEIDIKQGLPGCRLDLIFFSSKQNPFRINIMYNPGSIPEVMRLTDDNISELPSVFAYLDEDEKIVIGFAVTDIPGFDSVMVSCSAFVKDRIMDRTAIRILRLEKDPFR